MRRLPSARQIQPQLHVFDDMTRRQLRRADARPGEGHSRSHEVTGQRQRQKAGRADQVFHQPGKLRHTGSCSRTFRRQHQVQALNGAPVGQTFPRQPVDRAGRELTIGIGNDDDFRRVAFQVADPEIQREALAASGRVVALDHFGAGCRGYARCGVRAIVGDDDQAIGRQKLRQQSLQRLPDAGGLIMCRHQHRDARAPPLWLRGAVSIHEREHDLREQDQCRYRKYRRNQDQADLDKQRHVARILLRFITAGTPTAMELSGTSQSTTAFAPTTTLFPMLMGPSSFAPAPMSTLSPILGAAGS